MTQTGNHEKDFSMNSSSGINAALDVLVVAAILW